MSLSTKGRLTLLKRGAVFDFKKLDEVAFTEEGIEITYRDLLNEELAMTSPLLRAYLAWLAGQIKGNTA
jgi:hypothetical protein